MKIKTKNFLAIAAFASASATFHLFSSKIPDPDSFYHIRHSWLLKTGLFNTAFPWTYFSSIKTFGGDLWYGFHLLLAPFPASVFGIKLAGIIFTSALLLAFFWALSRQKISLPFFWPFVFFLSVPNALFQLVMMRPHVLSLALSILLFSFYISGPLWILFAASAGITFIHLGFFWIIGLIILSLLPLMSWKKILAVSGGALFGAILRPNPLQTIQLAYVQIIELMLTKQKGVELLFGKELAPLDIATLFKTSFVFLAIWLLAAALFLWVLYKYQYNFLKIKYEEKIFLCGGFILSVIFFLMSVFIARRSYIFWITFGTLFISALYTFLVSKSYAQKTTLKNLAASVFVVASVIALPYTIYKHNINMQKSAVSQEKFKESAEWLKENSNQGDIVFNTHWDEFSQLFFWNQKNYYIGGMDPIFQYDYDPGLYRKFHNISKDSVGELKNDAYKIFSDDFKARYIFIEKRRNPKLLEFLENDKRFEQKFKNEKEVIWLILQTSPLTSIKLP